MAFKACVRFSSEILRKTPTSSLKLLPVIGPTCLRRNINDFRLCLIRCPIASTGSRRNIGTDESLKSGYTPVVIDSSEKSFVCKLRGFPIDKANTEEIIKFLGGDIKVKGGKDGINFAVYRGKPPTLICFVELESHDDIDKALQKHLAYMGDRYVEVTNSTKEDMDWGLKRGKVDPSHGAYVKLRGTPYDTTKAEIKEFFEGLDIAPDGIIMEDNVTRRRLRSTFVQFTSKDAVEEALKRNRHNIRHRYIEVFRSSRVNVELALAYAGPESYKSYNDVGFNEVSVDPDIGDIDDFDDRRPRFQTFDRRQAGSGNRMPKVTHPFPTKENCVYMKGLPFSAREREVNEFFAPYEPSNIKILMNSIGNSSGLAIVQFSNEKDVEEAMKRKGHNMGKRFIELYEMPEDNDF